MLRHFVVVLVTILLNYHTDARIFSANQEVDNDHVTIIDRRTFDDKTPRERRNLHTDPIDTNTKNNLNFSQFVFPKDSNNVAFVFWKHAETSSIFILTCQDANTTNYNKLSNKGCKSQSRLYKSDNHGENFELLNLRESVNNDDQIHSIFLSPLNPKFMILTDYQNKRIFITENEGTTFVEYDVTFSPTYIYFHPKLSTHIAAFDSRPTGENSLYISEDSGKTWTRVAKRVLNYFWAHEIYDEDKTMFYEEITGSQIEEDSVGSILKKAMSPYDTTLPHTILQDTIIPFSLYVGHAYMIVQKYEGYELFISYARGPFTKLLLDKVSKTHLHHVVFSSKNDELIFGIIHPDLTATVYLSDIKGNNFIMLQEDILTEPMKEAGVAPKIDFYEVKGSHSTYIVNHKDKGTLISFDKGHNWNELNFKDEKNCTGDCQLILYVKIDSPFSDYTAPLLSKDSAPGFIIAQGYIGSVSQINRNYQHRHDCYISTDGGRTWIKRLQGTSGFALLDHGGLIAATQLKFTVEHPIEFSTDFGETWFFKSFTKLYSRIAAIITESTARSLVVNVFGFLQEQSDGSAVQGNTWVVWKFNFSTVLSSKCGDDDFEPYTHPRCILGQRVIVQRRKKDRQCVVGVDRKPKVERHTCTCDYTDYECDKKLYNRLNMTNGYKCIAINPKKTSDMSSCKNSDTYYESKGYKKLNGDHCKGGVDSELDPIWRRCPVVAPIGLQISVDPPSQIVAHNLRFSFTQTSGIHSTKYTWNFNDGGNLVQGKYEKVRVVTRAFYRHGLYNVSLTAENVAGKVTMFYLVPIIDDIYMNAFINFDEPLIENRANVFRLERLRNDGVSIQVKGEPSTQFIWSFGDRFLSDIRKPFAMHMFNKTGVYKVEVTVFSSISHRMISRIVTVYHNAVVFDVTFSSALDLYNRQTIAWMEDFKHKFGMFLAIKYNLNDLKRVIIRGTPTLPTKVTVIITDTEQTMNSVEDNAYSHAQRIMNDINKNRPFLHGYAASDIHVLAATHKRILIGKQSKPLHPENGGKTKAYVYVLIVLLLILLVGLTIAFYQYRRKGDFHCWRRRDGMESTLFSDVDDDVNRMEDANGFTDEHNHVTIYKPNQ